MSQFTEVFSAMLKNYQKDTTNQPTSEMMGLICKIFKNLNTEQLCEIIKLYCQIFENKPELQSTCDMMKFIGNMLKNNPKEFNLHEIFKNAEQVLLGNRPESVPNTSVPKTSVE